MAEELQLIGNTKEEKYESLLPQIKAMVSGENDLIANMANICAALKFGFNFLWVGFYIVKNDVLVLGSASPSVATRGSESLAGRITYHELDGLGLDEVGADRWQRLWLRGGFPRSFTAKSDASSMEWRRAFVQTYLERDVLDTGLRMPPAELRRFWQTLAHWHGQRWNASEFARAFGTSEATVRR